MKAKESMQDAIVGSDRKINNPRSPRYRSVKRDRVVPIGTRTGTRTGTTSHFARWKAEGALKSALQRLKLVQLADEESGDVAAGFAVLSVGGVKNVWDLSQMDPDGVLNKITINQFDAVGQFLKGKHVPLRWYK